MNDITDHQNAVFCVACANQLVQTAAFCPKCGTPRAHLPGHSPTGASKSKTTSVLLAVFLSFWSYLYSYKQDKVKFWVSLAGSVTAASLLFLVILLDSAGFFLSLWVSDRDNDLWLYPHYFAQLLVLITNLSIWITAVIVSARKPATFS